LGGLLLAQHAGTARERRGWMWMAWAALALATLTKGLIGIVLPGAALVAYTLATRDWALWRRLHLVSGLTLFLAIAAPWFVAVSRANPGFFDFFFIHEHFTRFLTNEHRRTGARWFFVPILLVGLLPWVVVFFAALPRTWTLAPREVNGLSWPPFRLAGPPRLFLSLGAW